MATLFTQDTRLGKLHTALDQDLLVLQRIGGEELLNGLFEFRVEALSTDPKIIFDDLLGTHMTVEIGTIDGDPRMFDGIVTQARWVGPGANGYQYEFVLRPWLWIAGKRRQQRIFHDMTAPEILEKVLAKYGALGQVSNQLRGSYPVLEYTVQYGESDLQFVRRLMERFGISFLFEHGDKKHDLVMIDSADDLPKIKGDSRKYIGNDTRIHGESEHFWSWKPERNFVTGAIRLTDYNFKSPDVQMETDQVSDAAYAQGVLEGYDFPGDYLDPGRGKTVASLRLDQERGGDSRHRAIGDVLSLSAGMRLKLDGKHEDLVKDKFYVCLSAQHFYESDAYGSGSGSGSGTSYTGSFVFIEDDQPIAPPRQTPTPVIAGPQTAVVVGSGEIDCDEFGRVLVQFHWDIDKAYSIRVRSGHNWAHKGYGGMTIPRIGMEVIVEFLNGDPDHPIITGHVYNGRNMPPYELPANKTRSTFKSKTHGGSGFNELRFEDESGKEEIFIHAQKDRNEKTLNNHTERIDANHAQSVGHNKAIEVKNNHTEAINGDMILNIGPSGSGSGVSSAGNAEGLASFGAGMAGGAAGTGNRTVSMDQNDSLTVGMNQSVTIAINQSTTVGAAITTTAGAAYSLTVGAGMTTSVGSEQTNTVGGDQTESIGANKSVSVGSNSSLSVAKDSSVGVGASAQMSVAKKYVIDVGDELTIKVGSAQLTMKKDGTIVLKGKNIKLDASSKVDIKASSDVTVKGSKVNMN